MASAQIHHANSSPRQPAQVERPESRRAPLQIQHHRRHDLKADTPLRLFGIDRSGKCMPAPRLIELEIVRLAEQQRELRGVVIAHGVDGGLKRDAGIATTPALRPSGDLANAANVNLLAVPGRGSEENTGMTGKLALGRVDQHAQIRICPLDMAPGGVCLFFRRRLREQPLDWRPGLTAVHNLDFDTHDGCLLPFSPDTHHAPGKLPEPAWKRQNSEISPRNDPWTRAAARTLPTGWSGQIQCV